MVGPPQNQPIMTTDLKLRFIHQSGEAWNHASKLSASFNFRQLLFEDIYVPPHNKAMVVFKFKNSEDKEKVLTHPDLEDILQRKGFIKHTPVVDDTTKESDRTVFIWRLSPLMFTPFKTQPELEYNKIYFENTLDKHFANKGYMDTELQFLHTPDLTPPKQMRIKFSCKEDADSFVAEDTRFEYIYIFKKFKKIDQHIPIPQCKTCRKKSHRTGHSDCQGDRRCPRCLSTTHFVPNDRDPVACPPYCWTHKEGHSTGSAKCPDNIAYRQQKRKENRITTERNNITRSSDPAQRQLNREIFNTRQDVKTIKSAIINPNSGPSFLEVARGNVAAAQTLQNFSPPGYVQAYLGAMLQSVYVPGPDAFEKIMNAYETKNGWVVTKHPPLTSHFIDALSDQEPLLPDNLDSLLSGRLRRTENTPRTSDSSRRRPRAPSSSPTPATPVTKTPRVDPSPLTESSINTASMTSSQLLSPTFSVPRDEDGNLTVLRGGEWERTLTPGGSNTLMCNNKESLDRQAETWKKIDRGRIYKEHNESLLENMEASEESELPKRLSLEGAAALDPNPAPLQRKTSLPDIPKELQKKGPSSLKKGKTDDKQKVKSTATSQTSPLIKKRQSSKIREELAKTLDSPVGIHVQHDASQPSHPAPKKLLKELGWKKNSAPKGKFPWMSLGELQQHIKANRVAYTPPGGINLLAKTVESLANSGFAEEKIYFDVYLKETVISKSGRVQHLPGSRQASPQRPSK